MRAKEPDEGITVTKKENFSEWYTQIVNKAELADIRFGIQGFIVHRPWGFFLIKKIYEYLEAAVEAQGHLPFLFPSVVKEENLHKEKEHAGFTPNVFWVSEAGDKKIEERFALRPTGEAQIYPLYALWFRSHKDLPFKGYQSRIPAFRNEMTTRPFLRGREFMFFETHDVFNTHEEALEQIEQDLATCKHVIEEKVHIPFFYFQRPQWDKFKGADNTYTPDTIMPDGKRNQLASTHDLGQNFSKAFTIKVKGKDEKDQFAWQTCFGPGVWRIMAALIGIHGDDKGLIIPFDMAPVQIVVIPILFAGKADEGKEVLSFCRQVVKTLTNKGYRVTLDDSSESPGYKYNKWEMKGVPVRLEIGPKETKAKTVSAALRTKEKRTSFVLADLTIEIAHAAATIDKDIHARAEAYFAHNVRSVDTLDTLKKTLHTHRGFVTVPFCSVDFDGEKCSDVLKAETDGGNVCGTLYPEEDRVKQGQICIICKKEANHLVYVAKSY